MQQIPTMTQKLKHTDNDTDAEMDRMTSTLNLIQITTQPLKQIQTTTHSLSRDNQ